jgi:ABC-2 type transport system ATP-binding protein
LSNLSGVHEVEVISSQHYKLKLTDDEENIEKVASEVIRTGAGLLELSPAHANLEDVFLKLTYGQEHESGV